MLTFGSTVNLRRYEEQRELAVANNRQLQDLVLFCSKPSHNTTLNRDGDWMLRSRILSEDSSTDSEIVKVKHSTPTRSNRPHTHYNVASSDSPGKKVLVRLKTPAWLPGTVRVLEILGAKAPFGWDFSLRPYKIISYGSIMSELIWMGDIPGIQRLFNSREASPFDQFPCGSSLVDVRQRHIRVIYCTC